MPWFRFKLSDRVICPESDGLVIVALAIFVAGYGAGLAYAASLIDRNDDTDHEMIDRRVP
jgi:hypothetical protein